MEEPEKEEVKSRLWDYFKNLVHIRGSIDSQMVKDKIYDDMVFKGHTVWILICSILIASIGLNVNSIPVVIGAMLISPLMGPIVAIGLSVGTYNWPRLIKALQNFGVMVGVSLVTSYIYFMLSPLKEPSNEILTRTYPTFLDVCIAFVGGAAGILAISRKEISNVIPGVAIATALMPPLCTAGYGLAVLDFPFFWGAIYLFTVNSIMIALATYIVVNYMRFPNYKYLDEKRARKLKRYMTLFIIAVLIPSGYMFYNLVEKSTFERTARQFITDVDDMKNSPMIKNSINYNREKPTVEIFFAGKELSSDDLDRIQKKFDTYGLENGKLIIKEASKGEDELRGDILSDLDRANRMNALEKLNDQQKVELEDMKLKLSSLGDKLETYEHFEVPIEQLQREIKIEYPEVEKFALANIIKDSHNEFEKTPCIFVRWNKMVSTSRREKFKKYVEVRINAKNLMVVNY
jgi:uncharacterized hydrophobic protein (TIGR00271 family)